MADPEIAQMAHLMRRAGFGATRDELERRVAVGYEATVEELLNPDGHGVPEIDVDMLFRTFPYIESGVGPPSASNRHMYYLCNNPRPLQEKVALLWHMIFATGNAKLDNPNEMARQINMFRELGLGSFQTLLLELSKNPAMIYWLDNNYNHKDQPNENWGRELLELFAMGQGNYTEQDVFECARAFTGWTLAPKPPTGGIGGRYMWYFRYVPEDHDDGEKVFLGHKGRFNGEDVIDIVVRQPATARFIARHIYNFFVADEVQVPSWLHTPPRDPVAVNIIADAFVSSGYNVGDTLRVLFNSDFFKESAFQRVKSPAEVIAGTMRLVGDFVYPRPGLEQAGLESSYMGQFLCDPPSVEGWHYGAEWIDSGALVKRINFCADAVSNIEYPGIRDIVRRIEAMGPIPPEKFVDNCLDLLGPIDVGDATRQELLVMAAQEGDLRWDTEEARGASAQRVGDMLALIASTREYQFG